MEESSKPSSRYAGEDTRLTSTKELWGWYAYGLAAEVFAVCGVGSFLPVMLEQLARERGVLRSDGITPCVEAAAAVPSLEIGQGSSSSSLFLLSRGFQTRESTQCVISLFGAQVDTSSFALYTFSLSVLVQALTLVSISAIADHGENRKRMLLALGFIGATACMLFLLVFPGIYLVGSLLAVVSITCLGSTFVLLNSFLPLLVSNHPSIRSSDEGADHEVGVPMVTLSSENDDADSPNEHFAPRRQLDVVPVAKAHAQLGTASPELRLSNQISSKGVGFSYVAAVIVQIIGIIIVVILSKLSPSTSKSTIPMRVVLFLVGLWWAVFTIPSALWLRPRPGPPLPPDVVSGRRWLSWLSYITFAWASLWKTIKVAMQLREVVLFLAAWFLLSDAIATISGTAILFAKTELQMGTAAVAAISIVATSSGIAGAFTWPIIGRRLGLESSHIIITCIILFEIIPIYGLSGFIPFIRAWGVGGLQQPWEIFPMALIHGFVMGGISSHCRSFFGMLIPPGSEAAFYALFAVTDKGSSVIGPAIVGHIVNVTGSIRLSFWFLAVLMILPAPLVWLVDVERGRTSGIMMAEKLRGRRAVPVEDREERHEQFEEREELLTDHYD